MVTLTAKHSGARGPVTTVSVNDMAIVDVVAGALVVVAIEEVAMVVALVVS